MEMNGQSSRQHEEVVEAWRQISSIVHTARHATLPSTTNELLRGEIKEDPDGPFSAAYLLWVGDNLFQEARFEEAIEVYDELVGTYPERFVGTKSLAAVALAQSAAAYERIGDPEQASRAHGRIAEAFGEHTSVAWAHYEQGRIAEAAGNDGEASSAYRRAASAADVPASTALGTNELARRAAERIENPGEGIRPQPEQVAREVVRALERRADDELGRLASPTHFTFGVVNSERFFFDRDKALKQLIADLRSSKVRADPTALAGCGEKRYLHTEGWSGELLAGRVTMILTRARDGWEWSGVALTQLPESAEGFFEPFERMENQPLALPIKAPFPAGTGMRAGGIIPFSIQVAAFAGLGPFAGVAIFAASLNPCGFGPGGLYYNQPSTHTGDEAFAIDFCRFAQGAPLVSNCRGLPMLAIADGLVTGVESNNATGSASSGNCVRLEHMTEQELFALYIIWLFTGRRQFMPFTSRVLHLDGPSMIPVSVGMHVKQGARLGRCDDTGNSVSDHLHFTVNDRRVPGATPLGRTVRPTPMDGQTLNDIDDGRCIVSTNTPIP